MFNILYVGNDDSLQETLEEYDFSSLWFVDVDDVKDYLDKHPEGQIDLFICDDGVKEAKDGLHFANEMHGVGHKVLVLSDFPVEGLPSFSKIEAVTSEGSLMAKIYELLPV